MESPLLKKIDLDFVQIELHENYLISTIKEGIVFDEEHLSKFYEIFDANFPNRPFGYISNRQFDYTVNPTCYMETAKYPNLLGIAIFCHTESSAQTAKFEKQFYSRPMDIFFSLEDSKQWVVNLVQNK